MARIEEIKRYLGYIASYFLNYPLLPPKEVNFQMTNRCPLRCLMCNIPKLKKRGREISTKLMKNVIDQTAELGVKYISFVGGEALVRKEDTIELIKYASSKGLYPTIVSNAHFLDKRTCEELLKVGLKRLALSLDGAREETHDKIRGKRNYRKVIRAMENMLKLRKGKEIKLDFTTVVMSYNFRELVDIYRLSKEMGVDQIFYQAVVPDNTYRNFDYSRDFWISGGELNEFKEVIKELTEIKRRDSRFIFNSIEYLRAMPEYFEKKGRFKPGICLAGFMNLNIDPYGIVDVCGIGPHLNVKEKSLKELWIDKKFWKTRKLIKSCKRACLMLCWEKIGLRGIVELLRMK